MADQLDFESEILFTTSPVPARKKKVIGLDDLLTDYYKEKNRLIEKESKRAKNRKTYDSDEEVDEREVKLKQYVDECQEKMGQFGTEEEIMIWGLQVFGNQKVLPSLVVRELPHCVLLKTFMNDELNSLIEINEETGGTFLEGLLADG